MIGIIYGYVGQKNFEINSRTISLILISRRSRNYAGVRYLRRGVNKSGDVANEVETEQILFEKNPFFNNLKISSFVNVIFNKL